MSNLTACMKMDWQQLSILMVGLICMGAALGFERSLLPRMAVEVWDIHSSTTVLNFVSTFGAAKAFANAIAGPLADRFGRKPALILGFVVGLPVMPYVNVASSWSGIIAMNVLFGCSQGLLGSALFFLLIDVMGPQRRGIAVGMGEATIYVSTAVINVVAGNLATLYGYRPVPFWVATVFAVVGLLSTIPLRDTLDQVKEEQNQQFTRMSSTIRTMEDENATPFDIDIEALRQEVMSNRLSVATSRKWNTEAPLPKAFGEAADNNSRVDPFESRKSTPPPLDVPSIPSDSPSTVRKLHENLLWVDSRLSAYQQGSDANDSNSNSDDPILQAYEVYDTRDSDLDSDDSDSEGKMLEEWDQAVRKSIQKIPQVLGHMPQNVLVCAACHPTTAVQSHPRTSAVDRDPTLINERTPLVLQTDEDYDVDDSDSDDDDDANNDVEYWDEVEEDMKALYPSAFHLLAHILWTNPNYVILCLAGMTMNFKDGFAWGSFPLFFSQFHHLNNDHTDMLVAIYPLCWGFAQAFTGALSDVYGRSLFLLMGFGACTIGVFLFFVPGFVWGRPAEEGDKHIVVWIISDVLLGLGTAMAYPALQAAVADEILPVYRGLGLGFYRFTRDMGYVVGALICGSLTDALGYPTTFLIVAAVLGVSFLGILSLYKPLKLG